MVIEYEQAPGFILCSQYLWIHWDTFYPMNSNFTKFLYGQIFLPMSMSKKPRRKFVALLKPVKGCLLEMT